MTDITRIPPPPGTPPEMRAWWQTVATRYLADLDARFAEWAGSAGLVVNDDGTVTAKAGLGIVGRSGSALPTMLQRIANSGTATDQRLLPMVAWGNVSSVQDVEPLSAASGASTADITIDAHTLYTDFDDIAFNGGSVLGLSLNTRYYVYADNAESGGAVTYVASTSRPNITGATSRYLVGTITTPAAANTANISAATSANPIEFTTSANHGWTTGDSVTFAALPGDFGTNLNGTTRTITVTAVDKFTIAVNGGAYAAYTTGGTATRVVVDTLPDFGGGGGGFIP